MFTKKFFLTFAAVFITLEVIGYILFFWLMGDTWRSEEVSKFLRPEEDMWGKIWIVYLMDLVWAFFFTFFFAKGYENKGIAEGLRFGFYNRNFLLNGNSLSKLCFLPLSLHGNVSNVYLWFNSGASLRCCCSFSL
jgi:hypothetical protein